MNHKLFSIPLYKKPTTKGNGASTFIFFGIPLLVLEQNNKWAKVLYSKEIFYMLTNHIKDSFSILE